MNRLFFMVFIVHCADKDISNQGCGKCGGNCPIQRKAELKKGQEEPSAEDGKPIPVEESGQPTVAPKED